MSIELNEEFSKNPLAFFKKYPVLPPGSLGQPLQSLGNIFDKDENVEGAFKQVVGSETAAKDRILWIDFKQSKSMNEPGAMTFSGASKPTGGLKEVPIYFLPWKTMNVTRPMRVSEFYPGGPHRFISTPLQREVL